MAADESTISWGPSPTFGELVSPPGVWEERPGNGHEKGLIWFLSSKAVLAGGEAACHPCSRIGQWEVSDLWGCSDVVLLLGPSSTLTESSV